MSLHITESELAARLRGVLKEHQREGLNMIGNVDQLVTRLTHAVHDWIAEADAQGKKTA